MFPQRSDRIADAVRLLAAVGAAMADPTLLGALKSGPAVYDALKRVAAAPPSSVGRLANTLAAEARALFDATRDLPPDAEILYAQMVEHGLVGPAEIVAGRMDAAAIVEAMLAKLRDPQHRTPEMQVLFRRLTVPTLTRLLADKAFASDLTPAFMQAILGQLGSLGEMMQRLDRVSRNEMEALANRFEIEQIFALSDGELRLALEKRAEQYRAYRDQIASIDDRVAGLGNLKAAAQGAADRLDFDEVERLLSQVDEAETEIAAEAKVLRADNALLRGRAEDAFRMLSAAADSFASVSPVETSRRRLTYADRFLWAAFLYPDGHFPYMERMIRRALEDLSEESAAELWAATQNRLGDTLRMHGDEYGSYGASQLYDEAAEAYGAALRVFTESAHPADWARTQDRLGSVLLAHGSLFGYGPERVRLVDAAVDAHGAALRVFSRSAYPVEWARTQNDLGKALLARGDEEALDAAIDLHHGALEVFTEAARPHDWARTQCHLGAALAAQGRRAKGAEAATLLTQAVKHYRSALRHQTEDAQPLRWAETVLGLGLALEALARDRASSDREAALAEAARCFEGALRVYRPAYAPPSFRNARYKAAEAAERARTRLRAPSRHRRVTR